MTVAECSLVVMLREHLGIKHQLEMAFVFQGSQGLATFRIQQVHRQETWLKSKARVCVKRSGRPTELGLLIHNGNGSRCPQTTQFRIVFNHVRTIFYRSLLMAWRYSETLKETLCAFLPCSHPFVPWRHHPGTTMAMLQKWHGNLK